MKKFKKTLVKIGSAFLPKSQWRKDFREYFLGSHKTVHKVYGKIYPPIYNMRYAINGGAPEIYNGDGQKMEAFFIRDHHLAHDPYCLANGLPPSHFIWDRYNIALGTHFYSHGAMLETMGNPSRRFGMMMESEAIVPEGYKIFQKNRGLEKDFDAIFTYSDKLLDEVSNAKFMPFCAAAWYGTDFCGGTIDEKAFEKKRRNISIVSSDKCLCEYHKYRIELARLCSREGLADAYGTFDGGSYIKIADSLTDYRYSIAIENDQTSYFFTEKIIDCFLAMTVPIYFGAKKIGEFFNEDGIILISPSNDSRKILSQCSPKDYESRIPAIIDNFNRALKYRNIWDLMYDKYLKKERIK